MIWQWDKAFDVQYPGVSSLDTALFALPVAIFRYRSKAGIFAVIPGFQTCALPYRRHYNDMINNGKKLWFQTCTFHVLAHTSCYITPPAILPRSIHSP